MNNGPGQNDEVQGLYIGISGEDIGASATFSKVLDAYKDAEAQITRGNESMASSATSTAATMAAASRQQSEEARLAAAEEQRLAQARVDGAAATSNSLKNQLEIRQRMAQVDRDATESSTRYVDAVRREIAVLQEQARAGEISAQQRAQQTRESYAVPTSEGRYSAPQLREGALIGDADLTQRYRAYIAVQKEVEAADRAVTEAIVADARRQVDATRDSVRFGQSSREEAAEQYRQQLRDFESYADARNLIQRRLLENEAATNREQQRASGGHGSAAADALLNVGYALPGPIGNAAVNLGYLGMAGPEALAIGGGALAAAGAAGATVDFVKKAADDEAAIKKLQIAVTDSGASWAMAGKEIQAFADLQTRTTVYGRDQTIPAIQQLIDGGIKYADALKITRVAEDLSSGSGKSLAESTEALRNAYEGNARGLVSLGVVTKEQIANNISFTGILDSVEEKMGGQATTTETLDAKTKLFQTSVADLERSIGTELIGAFKDATDAGTKFVRSLDGKAIGSGISDLIKQLIEAGTQLDQLGKQLDGLNAKSATTGKDSGDWFREHFFPTGAQMLAQAGDGPTTGNTRLTTEPLSQMADAAAVRAGVDPTIFRRLVQQESGFNPSATSSAGAVGLGQLMPDTARGLGLNVIQPGVAGLDDRLDPAKNLDASARYLAQMVLEFGTYMKALTAYNAGPGNVQRFGENARFVAGADPNYALGILSSPGGSGGPANPANTNVVSPNTVRPADELTKLRLTFGDEERKGIQNARSEYENALAAIRDDQSKSDSERLAAQNEYNALVKQDLAAQLKGQTEASRAIERAFAEQLRSEEIVAKQRHEGAQQQIGDLQKIRETREAQGGPDMQADVDKIDARIETLQTSFAKTLSQLGTVYKDTNETLDQYIAKVRELERGATPEQKTVAEAAISGAIESAVSTAIKAAGDAYKALEAGGASRSQLEAGLRTEIGSIRSIPNRSDATASTEITNALVGPQQTLGGDYSSDASQAVKALDAQYKALTEDVNTSGLAQSMKQADIAALLDREREQLEHLQQNYAAYGHAGDDAVKSIQASIEALAQREHDATQQATEDLRRELEQRAAEYRQFTDTASERLEHMFEAGREGAGGWQDTAKSAIKGIEDDFMRSSIASVFFPGGNGTPFNPGADIQKALFGATAPAGIFGAGGADGSAQQLASAAFTRIAQTPTGKDGDALTVTFDQKTLQALTGSPAGVLPGSDTANAAAGSILTGTSPGGGGGSLGGLGIIGSIGALASGLFSHSPSGPPVNAQQMANLYGQYTANGNTTFQDPSIAHAFGANVTGFQGVENLIGAGQSAFSDETGLSAAQYALYKQMFSGSSPSSKYSSQQYSSALDQILNGLGVMNLGTPVDSYSFSRSFPNANQSTLVGSGTYLAGVDGRTTGGPGIGAGILGPSATSAAIAALTSSSSGGWIGAMLGLGATATLASQLATSLSSSAVAAPVGSNSSWNGLASVFGSSSASSSSLSSGGIATLLGIAANAAPGSSITNPLGIFASSGSTSPLALASSFLGGGSAGGAGSLSGLFSSFGSLFSNPNNTDASGFSAANYNAYNPTSGGTSIGAQNVSGALAGFGYGETLNSILGGNSTYGTIGSAIGAGVGIIGGPLGSAIGGSLGGVIGGLFGPHWGPASNYPDRSDTTRYGTILADLFGTSNPNGQSFYEDPSIEKAFNGQNGISGIGALLSGGQAAFTEETGLSSAQYAQILKMFGSGATTLKTPTSNVGILEGTGAGASGTYSYTQYGQVLQEILGGLSATGVVGPYNSYTFSRTYPGNANMLSSTGTSSTYSGSGQTTGSGATPTTPASTSAAAATSATTNDFRNSIFVGSSEVVASQLADMIAKAQQMKSTGKLPDPLAAGVATRKPSA